MSALFKHLVAMTSNELEIEQVLAICDTYEKAVDAKELFEEAVGEWELKGMLKTDYEFGLEVTFRIFTFPIWTEEHGSTLDDTFKIEFDTLLKEINNQLTC